MHRYVHALPLTTCWQRTCLWRIQCKCHVSPSRQITKSISRQIKAEYGESLSSLAPLSTLHIHTSPSLFILITVKANRATLQQHNQYCCGVYIAIDTIIHYHIMPCHSRRHPGIRSCTPSRGILLFSQTQVQKVIWKTR
jgi:hypothetical protein